MKTKYLVFLAPYLGHSEKFAMRACEYQIMVKCPLQGRHRGLESGGRHRISQSPAALKTCTCTVCKCIACGTKSSHSSAHTIVVLSMPVSRVDHLGAPSSLYLDCAFYNLSLKEHILCALKNLQLVPSSLWCI